MKNQCSNCKFWVKSHKVPTLKICQADTNHLALVGPTFYCANWEKQKGSK